MQEMKSCGLGLHRRKATAGQRSAGRADGAESPQGGEGGAGSYLRLGSGHLRKIPNVDTSLSMHNPFSGVSHLHQQKSFALKFLFVNHY